MINAKKLSQYSPKISQICLTETFLNSNIQDSELFCSNYSVYRRDRATTASKKLDGGGVLLAVRNNFAVGHILAVRNNFAVGHMFDLQSVAEDVWLSVECVGGRVLICGVYLPPGDELAQQAFLSNLQAVTLDHPDEKILILGDFNLPSIVWSQSRGNHLQPSVYDNKA
ncbi:Endonuclease-reverse transcriptase [Popillia japonica]|uniref:Endonuclease-reverse transcriptase n=1 Tax=Popillia japonica TaxID=7064 RepID=A0AAW1IE67_POPJA